MPIESAGLLVYRRRPDGPEVLLAHPGGPYWCGRDLAAWSIPKGLPEPGETLLNAALREFREETNLPPPEAGAALTPARTPGGKIVHCWLAEADLDLNTFRSNPFELEWPPRSGRSAQFPEVDRIHYFPQAQALERVHRGQVPILLEAFARLRD